MFQLRKIVASEKIEFAHRGRKSRYPELTDAIRELEVNKSLPVDYDDELDEEAQKKFAATVRSVAAGAARHQTEVSFTVRTTPTGVAVMCLPWRAPRVRAKKGEATAEKAPKARKRPTK